MRRVESLPNAEAEAATMSLKFVSTLMDRLNGLGEWIAPLGLRVLLAWEFYESGLEKLHGENWFAELAGKFPPPFSLLGPDVNWALATWLELLGSLALLFGLGTRFFAVALSVLTVVAIAAVHWPAEWSTLAELWQGYSITDHGFGNYKLPLIYLVMLLPLILQGAGRASLDHLLWRHLRSSAPGRSLNPRGTPRLLPE
ncbi:hypothetical protein GCM10011487_46720 [Steroidobacter agaridevorans]|uniref:DoxX family protein n=2 Tax=Steroidobacter agaridevorans TaxID=2695856 RepID=A0A829YIK1_9GAMM|nr:hypothetical protein GCM10011487_46720 [Steroidobacter agaridevorans]GFE85759.1 hypothetical protein GCM10011488_07130 [Steroidobacter agaridevorans]